MRSLTAATPPSAPTGQAAAPARLRRPPVPIPPQLPLLLEPDLVAALLSMSRRSFDRAVAVGDFPPADVRRGAKFVRWKQSTVTEWIEQQTTAGSARA